MGSKWLKMPQKVPKWSKPADFQVKKWLKMYHGGYKVVKMGQKMVKSAQELVENGQKLFKNGQKHAFTRKKDQQWSKIKIAAFVISVPLLSP